jgi:predicted amidophosphoribosyltransferase
MTRRPKPEAKPEPARDRCPGCGKDKKAGALICGFCWSRLTWDTQNKLCAKGPERLQHVSRLKRALAQGYKPEEIRL